MYHFVSDSVCGARLRSSQSLSDLGPSKPRWGGRGGGAGD